jgi:hypothetical protein
MSLCQPVGRAAREDFLSMLSISLPYPHALSRLIASVSDCMLSKLGSAMKPYQRCDVWLACRH